MIKNAFFFTIIILGTLFISCQPDVLIEQTIEIPDGKWTYKNKANFEFQVSDTTKLYDIILKIEHSEKFPFQNLYFRVSTKYPSEKQIEEVTSIDFCDKAGVWYGKCNSRKCVLKISLQKNVSFNEIGTHIISFEQFSRKNPLAGIQKITLRIQEIKNNQ